MSLSTRSTRSRVAALATGLALSLSLVAAPAVVAESDAPEAAVQGLLTDIEAGNFDALAGWFCPEFADQAAALDLSVLTAELPPTVDASTVLDAFSFSVVVDTIETISQTDTEATVNLVASLTMDVDAAGMEPLIVAILEAGGQEATPDMVELVGGMMASEIAGEAIDISEEITVVPNEDGSWGQICSELGGDDVDGIDADPVTDPVSPDDATSTEEESDGE